MNARLLAVTRIVKRLGSLLFGLVPLFVVTATLAAYLAATGRSLPILRAAAARIGAFTSGQRTEQLTLDVRVAPSDGRLSATATLTMRSLEDKRQRFYFLLNNGLRIRSVRVSGVDPAGRAPAAYQLWLLTVVDVGAPVAKDATVHLTFEYDGSPAGGLFSIASHLLNAQQVLLNVDAFWYPNDVQSFFTTDVTVTLPRTMTLVHNGAQATRFERGTVQQVHWISSRPINGMALVAGSYGMTTREVDGITYRLYVGADLQLDAARLLVSMADANRTLSAHYGSSGYKQVTMFVSDDFRRAFNDGSGLMGLSLRYIRAGDYGFAIVAHELAHDWWGGTVAGQWLVPGSGSEWIVEGFAEFSSLVATEAEYGADALARRLASERFDPARQGVVADMSVLDNVMPESTALETIYRKGAYVAMMLRRNLGDDVCFNGLRQFIDRFRYQQATHQDLQQVLQESSGQPLDAFFADWVRADRLVDLSLDGTNQAEVTVSNLGTANAPGDTDLLVFPKGGGGPDRKTVHAGDHVPWPSDTDYGVLDPLLLWADVQRENNRYPRRNDPVYVAASAQGEIAVTAGEPLPWVRTTLSTIDQDGRTLHTWDFDRGLLQAPMWAADGTRLVVSYSDAEAALPSIITLAADGGRRTVGHGTSPAPGLDGAIYAGRLDRIVRIASDGSESTVAQRRGETLDQPRPSPDGTQLAYTTARGNSQELRVVSRAGADDRLLLTGDRDRLLYRWSSDGTRLYTIIGGTWDWQIWEVPLAAEPTRALASAAAAIGDLAVSPDGGQLAFTAAPTLDYPLNRRQLYVMQLVDRRVRSIDIPNADVSQLTWTGADTLLVVATPDTAGQPFMLPAERSLKRVRVSAGSVEELQ